LEGPETGVPLQSFALLKIGATLLSLCFFWPIPKHEWNIQFATTEDPARLAAMKQSTR